MSEKFELTAEQIEQIVASGMRAGAFMFHVLRSEEQIREHLSSVSKKHNHLLEFSNPTFLHAMFEKFLSDDSKATDVIMKACLFEFMNTDKSPEHYMLLDKLQESSICWDITNLILKHQEKVLDEVREHNAREMMTDAMKLKEKVEQDDSPLAKKILAVQDALKEVFGDIPIGEIDHEEFEQKMRELIEKEFSEDERAQIQEIVKSIQGDENKPSA